MKTTSIIAFILLLALAMSGDATGASAPYEIVLEGETVVFDKAETVTSQIVIRDLGVKKMIAPDLYWVYRLFGMARSISETPRTLEFGMAMESPPRRPCAPDFPYRSISFRRRP